MGSGKFTLEAPLVNEKEEYLPTVIADDGQSSYWTVPAAWGSGSIGTPTLADDTAEKLKGTNCLKITVPSGAAAQWGIYRDYSPNVDWSPYDCLCMYIYGLNSGKTFISELRAPDASNKLQWSWTDNWSGWRRLVLPLRRGDYAVAGTPNLATVSCFWPIIAITANSVGPYYLDRVLLDYFQPARLEIQTPDVLSNPKNVRLYSYNPRLANYQLFYDPTCVLYIPFDEYYGTTVRDMSGNNLHGTASGTTIVAGASGYGRARSMNGTSDHISCGDQSLLEFAGDFTILTRFKADSLPSERIIVSKWGGSGNAYVLDISPTKLRAELHDGTTSEWKNGATTLSTGTWYVGGLRRSAGVGTLWLNGQLDGTFTNTITGAVGVNSAVFDVGAYGNGAGWWFPGTIDEILAFARALSSDEIASLSSDGVGLNFLNDWRMGEVLTTEGWAAYKQGARGESKPVAAGDAFSGITYSRRTRRPKYSLGVGVKLPPPILSTDQLLLDRSVSGAGALNKLRLKAEVFYDGEQTIWVD